MDTHGTDFPQLNVNAYSFFIRTVEMPIVKEVSDLISQLAVHAYKEVMDTGITWKGSQLDVDFF